MVATGRKPNHDVEPAGPGRVDRAPFDDEDDLASWPRPAPPGAAWQEAIDRLRGFGARKLLAGALLAVGLAVGGWWFLRPGPTPIEQAMPLAAGASGTSPVDGSTPGTGGEATASTGVTGPAGGSTTTGPAPLVVQAAGAVVRPGVYRLDPGARVDDLVRAAGGMDRDADGDRVNLAAPVADGERVWVPRRDERAPPDVVAGTGGAGGTTPSSEGSGGTAPGGTPAVVDLNTATAEQLDTLPGVGPATATAILAYRTEHGRFSSVDELMEVRGIGEARLEQMRPLVRV